jgi:hypothetical protein
MASAGAGIHDATAGLSGPGQPRRVRADARCPLFSRGTGTAAVPLRTIKGPSSQNSVSIYSVPAPISIRFPDPCRKPTSTL